MQPLLRVSRYRIAIHDRVEHRPDRVARGEDGLLLTERCEVDGLSGLERLDARIAGSVKGDLAAVSEPAQELPWRDIATGTKDRVHVQQAIRTVPEREKRLDRRARGAVQADRRPLDPVIREHRAIVAAAGV